MMASLVGRLLLRGLVVVLITVRLGGPGQTGASLWWWMGVMGGIIMSAMLGTGWCWLLGKGGWGWT